MLISIPDRQEAVQVHSSPSVRYVYYPQSEVHHIMYLESSRAAVEEWAQVMNAIYIDLPDDAAVRLMLDERLSGALPLTYAINRGVRWARSMGRLTIKTRLAYMFHDAKIAPLGNAMMAVVQRQIRTLNVRLFAPNQEAEAVQWLTDPIWLARA